MLQEDRLNQHIRQTLEKPSTDRITVEVEETFGGGNQNFIEIERELLVSMEYAEGMLIVEYFKAVLPSGKGAPHSALHARCVEMIAKDRIKRVSFDEATTESRLPFPPSKGFDSTHPIHKL